MFGGEALEETLLYLFYQIVEAMNEFTASSATMGVEALGEPLVKGVIYFFKLFGYGLWGIGMIYAIFEFCLAYQTERTTFYGTGMNMLKSFIAVSLFTTLPVVLFHVSVDAYSALASALTTSAAGDPPTTMQLVQSFFQGALATVTNTIFSGPKAIKSVWDFITGAKDVGLPLPLQTIIQVVVMLYVVIKVYIGNLKRSGILLIMICTGSLHMISIPRGYTDGFSACCKQMIALCFTVFMQNILFTLGLIFMEDSTATYAMLGFLLAAAEVPRIAQAFGLETSTKANISGAAHTASSAVTMIKSFAK